MVETFLSILGFSFHFIGIALLMLYLLSITSDQIQVNQSRAILLWMGCGSLFIAEFQIVSESASIFAQIKRGRDELNWQASSLFHTILFITLALGLLSKATQLKANIKTKQTIELNFWLIALFLGTLILTYLYGQIGLSVYSI